MARKTAVRAAVAITATNVAVLNDADPYVRTARRRSVLNRSNTSARAAAERRNTPSCQNRYSPAVAGADWPQCQLGEGPAISRNAIGGRKVAAIMPARRASRRRLRGDVPDNL